jgi:hypothetical protein
MRTQPRTEIEQEVLEALGELLTAVPWYHIPHKVRARARGVYQRLQTETFTIGGTSEPDAQSAKACETFVREFVRDLEHYISDEGEWCERLMDEDLDEWVADRYRGARKLLNQGGEP